MSAVKHIVEALLFSSKEPVTAQQLIKLLPDFSPDCIRKALVQLLAEAAANAKRGVTLVEVAGGYQFRTNPNYKQYIERLFSAKKRGIPRTVQEVLAIVAYKQPVTRAEVDHLRGVDSGAQIRTLISLDMVSIIGKKEDMGRPNLYGTTPTFLKKYQLKNLRELPQLGEITLDQNQTAFATDEATPDLGIYSDPVNRSS